MSYTPPVAQVQIAVAENGNPQVTVIAWRDKPLTGRANEFPPIALPGATFPDAFAAQEYAEALLVHGGVISQEVAAAGLVWVSSGYTVVGGRRLAVRRAPIPHAGWVPLAGTRN